MSLAFTEHDVAVWQGDALEQLTLMPAGSVQCAVTSPPYFGLRDYGVAGQLGLESSPAEYVARMVAVFAEVRRVLAADGVLWLNLGDSYASQGGKTGVGPNAVVGSTLRQAESRTRPALGELAPKNLLGMPWRVAFALQDDGWILRNAVVWHKPNAMPESVTDRLPTRYELVFLFSKSRRYWFDLDPIREPIAHPGNSRSIGIFQRTKSEFSGGGHAGLLSDGHPLGRNPGDVWSIPTSPFPGAHFACMPPALAERCIKAGCPERLCRECGHTPSRITERADRAELRAKYAHRGGTALEKAGRNDGDWKGSGQEYAQWRAENPDRVVGWTDCGHNAYSAGTVLDPFAGSGTTLAAARKLGRKSVGIELNPDYIDLIRDRIGQAPLEFDEAAAPTIGLEPCAVQDRFDFGEAAL